jgi:UDP-N-acetylglucosamine/UDP-N-acetylgalactosamine diphosphorylase
MLSSELRRRLEEHGQEHMIAAVEAVNGAEQATLVQQLEGIDFAELRTLYAKRDQKDALPERSCIAKLPVPVSSEDERDAFWQTGEKAFMAGRVAFLMVAGGQGTRLGFDQPKGVFPIGPVSKKPLFRIHAEKVIALNRRYGRRFPLLVMTSPATDSATREYFRRKNFFRLPPEDVWFFCQGTMPALDLATGKLLLEAPGQLCLSPDGHGGTITALASSGILKRLQEQGINTIYYFQVDNPLVNLADTTFLGRHQTHEAQVSSKVLPKAGPLERVGNFALVNGRCAMIEYSDLPKEWAHETDESGQLLFWAANPAIHLFDVDFLGAIAKDVDRLPWHVARKKVPHVGNMQPATENGLKFERFIFDALPQAERWTVLPTERADEFAPVKNKDGVDSPATARELMSNQAVRWLRSLGVEVAEGITVEIDPLLAMDMDGLQDQYRGPSRIDRNTYIKFK